MRESTMLGVTHAATAAAGWVAGCATLAAIGPHPSLPTVVIGGAVAAAGGLIPDFDHPSSLASRSLWPVTAVAAWATRAVSRAVYLATATDRDDQASHTGRHRALTHTVPFAVTTGLATSGALALAGSRWPLAAGWWWLGLPLGVGCLIHTLGDWCTTHGVPLLWPIVSGGRRWRRVGAPLRIRTGGWGERVVFAAAVAVSLGATWRLLP